MNVRKLPSGSYQIRKQYKGKQYSFTLDHKPTQKEVIQLLADVLDDEKANEGTFNYYAEKYIDIKKGSLSPNTLFAYGSMNKNVNIIRDKQLHQITNEDIQLELKEYSKTHSPKSTRNLKGFISAVFSMYRPSFKVIASTPQQTQNSVYVPTDKEVHDILELAEGTPYEIPLWLSVYGLRRGEICALTVEDLSDNNELTINKSYTNHDGGHIKPPKTKASNRTIYIPDFLADKIRKQGYIYNGHIHTILKALHRFQDQLGIEHFRLHDMRHYFASVVSEMGLKEADILALGGWATPHVMKTRYRHSRINQSDTKKQEISKKLAQNLAQNKTP